MNDHVPDAFFAHMLDAVTQAVIAVDGNGVIQHWNRQAALLFGAAPEDARGRSMESFVAPTNASRTMLQRLVQLQSASGEIVTAGDTGIPLLVTAVPVHDAAGRVRCVVLQAEDITERQRAEHEQRLLAEAGAILARSLESGEILDRLCRLLVPDLADGARFHIVDENGVTRSIAASHGDAAFTPGIAVPLHARGRTVGALELSRRSDRTFDQRHVRLAEEVARRAAVHVDNQRLYEAAVLASKSKSDFLAVISHELRTPLTTIMGYVELMASGVAEPLPPKASGYLDRVRTAAWHLLGLIEQILVYARMEAGRENLMPEPVIMNQLLDDVRALIEPNAIEKGLAFVIEPVDEFMFTTDLTKVRQILLNLASNAVKFTDAGEIRIDARTTGAEVVITVRDTGIGISAEHAEQVFDAFWQVDQSSTRRVGGAGLGLSVSRRLARLLGGDLTFTSSLGRGTTFVLTLPRGWKPREDTSSA